MDVFCSATLVAEQAVITARHCIPEFSSDPNVGAFLEAGFLPVFVYSENALFSQAFTPIVDYVVAPPVASNGGLLQDGGRDIAVAYLASAPEGVKPAKLGEFKSSQLGKRFKIAGYGRNGGPEGGDPSYYGDRFVGSATARADHGEWYPLLFRGNYKKFLNWYHTDSVYAFDGQTSDQEAASLWHFFALEPKFEILVGGLKGESVPCHGDSGGPLFLEEGKNITVYGSSFAVEDSASKVCALGSAYVAFNDTIIDFVREATGVEEVKKPRKNCFHGHKGKGHNGKGHKGHKGFPNFDHSR